MYQVSNLGRVKSLNYKRTKKEGILKAGIQRRTGYLSVTLLKEGVQKTRPIHRLVAEAFIPKIEGKNEINHIDENKENNSVLNLQWCNHKENSNYGTRSRRLSEAIKKYWRDKS